MTTDEILDAKESFDFLKGAKRELVKVAMVEYARRKCAEQREICEQNLMDDSLGSLGNYSESILNAPEPKLN